MRHYSATVLLLIAANQVSFAHAVKDKPVYQLKGYMQGVHSNGGLNSTTFFADVELSRTTLKLDQKIRLINERAYRSITIDQNGVAPNDDSTSLYSSVKHIRGLNGVYFKQTLRPLSGKWSPGFGIANENHAQLNIARMDTYQLGYTRRFQALPDQPKLSDRLTFSTGIAHKSIRQGENTSNYTGAYANIHYQHEFTASTSMDLALGVQAADGLMYRNAHIGLHFWFNQNFAFSISHSTNYYGDGFDLPAELGGKSTSVTAFGVLFRNKPRITDG